MLLEVTLKDICNNNDNVIALCTKNVTLTYNAINKVWTKSIQYSILQL